MRKKKLGFTLIELMIVLAIIAILASVAYPMYQDAQRKSRRADAQGELSGLANALERFFTENSTYACTGGGICSTQGGGPPAVTPSAPNVNVYGSVSPRSSSNPSYNLTIQAVGQTTYTIRATPVAGGPQVVDGCLVLTNTGNKFRDKTLPCNNVFDTGTDLRWDEN